MQITLPTGVWDIEWVEGALIIDGIRRDFLVNDFTSVIRVAIHQNPFETLKATAAAVAEASREPSPSQSLALRLISYAAPAHSFSAAKHARRIR